MFRSFGMMLARTGVFRTVHVLWSHFWGLGGMVLFAFAYWAAIYCLAAAHRADLSFEEVIF